jgi:hypothetical protein
MGAPKSKSLRTILSVFAGPHALFSYLFCDGEITGMWIPKSGCNICYQLFHAVLPGIFWRIVCLICRNKRFFLSCMSTELNLISSSAFSFYTVEYFRSPIFNVSCHKYALLHFAGELADRGMITDGVAAVGSKRRSNPHSGTWAWFLHCYIAEMYAWRTQISVKGSGPWSD